MQELEKKLNYTFRNPALLAEALSHSSYANEHRAEKLNSNERLEFLGDSVLGFVTAEFLFAGHPDMPEGDLTRIRAALVCEESLHEVAQSLELGNYLKLGRGEESGGGRRRPSILADATARVQPPSDKGRRLKIYYMTQASTKPPHFVIFCNDARLFHFSYQRYLENQIREVFGLQGTPVRITIRQKGEKED